MIEAKQAEVGVDVSQLGLSAYEQVLLRQCSYARTQVASGDFLPAPRLMKSAARLIERGFLTRSEDRLGDLLPRGWIVVRLSERNLAALRLASAPRVDA